jgi:HTH-type transcriptional regulator/antitoxin HipB
MWRSGLKNTRARISLVYTFAIEIDLYAITHIDWIYAIAYYRHMDTIARTTRQLGAGIRRYRRQKGLSQQSLGEKMHARQATVSKLESGESATQLQIVMNALAALDLELVIRPRTTVSSKDIEELF